MGQLTVYIDDATLKIIGLAAKKERTSVSLWVKKRLVNSLKGSWPPGFFDLFGSLKEGDMQRPPQGSFKDDRPRPAL